MSRSRGWCLTLNNYTDKSIDNMKKYIEDNCSYGVIGKEIGESGTPHLQMYIEFKTVKSFKQVKAINKKLHVEKRNGTKEEAANYCKKDGDFIEIGVLLGQGNRSDINMVKEAVNEGKRMIDICEITNSYQAIKYAETLRKYKQVGRDWKTEVYWFYGPTGTGKSKRAHAMANKDSVWVNMDSMKWWDGYDGHEDVIIDDFRAADCSMKYMLRVLDRYEFRIEVKGGSTQLLAKRIFITTNSRPEDSFTGFCVGDVQQLLRRIEHVWCFSGRQCCFCNEYLYDDELHDCGEVEYDE